eukprot:TRINITY_DN348_c0_g1_i23.p1 TRINITY_DN348_c0_g1~~TRINITY_DN348_c0_g1_i23.p1  ORF type:complete len:1080 (-),score=504.34 TRINITY_DN348_c0_g1_i23:381-3620(-)
MAADKEVRDKFLKELEEKRRRWEEDMEREEREKLNDKRMELKRNNMDEEMQIRNKHSQQLNELHDRNRKEERQVEDEFAQRMREKKAEWEMDLSRKEEFERQAHEDRFAQQKAKLEQEFQRKETSERRLLNQQFEQKKKQWELENRSKEAAEKQSIQKEHENRMDQVQKKLDREFAEFKADLEKEYENKKDEYDRQWWDEKRSEVQQQQQPADSPSTNEATGETQTVVEQQRIISMEDLLDEERPRVQKELDEKLEELRTEHEEQIRQLEEAHNERVGQVKKEHRNDQRKLLDQHDDNLKKLRAEYQDKEAEEERKHKEHLEKNKADRLESMRSDLSEEEQKLLDSKKALQELLLQGQREHDEKVAQLKQEIQELEDQRKKLARDLKREQSDADKKKLEIRARLDKYKESNEKHFELLEEERMKLQLDYDKEVAAIKDTHAQKLAQLQGDLQEQLSRREANTHGQVLVDIKSDALDEQKTAQKEISDMKFKLLDERADVEREQRQLNALKEKLDRQQTELDQRQVELDSEKATLERNHQMELKRLNEHHNNTMSRLQTEFMNAENELQAEIRSIERKKSTAQSAFEAWTADLEDRKRVQQHQEKLRADRENQQRQPREDAPADSDDVDHQSYPMSSEGFGVADVAEGQPSDKGDSKALNSIQQQLDQLKDMFTSMEAKQQQHQQIGGGEDKENSETRKLKPSLRNVAAMNSPDSSSLSFDDDSMSMSKENTSLDQEKQRLKEAKKIIRAQKHELREQQQELETARETLKKDMSKLNRHSRDYRSKKDILNAVKKTLDKQSRAYNTAVKQMKASQRYLELREQRLDLVESSFVMDGMSDDESDQSTISSMSSDDRYQTLKQKVKGLEKELQNVLSVIQGTESADAGSAWRPSSQGGRDELMMFMQSPHKGSRNALGRQQARSSKAFQTSRTAFKFNNENAKNNNGSSSSLSGRVLKEHSKETQRLAKKWDMYLGQGSGKGGSEQQLKERLVSWTGERDNVQNILSKHANWLNAMNAKMNTGRAGNKGKNNSKSGKVSVPQGVNSGSLLELDDLSDDDQVAITINFKKRDGNLVPMGGSWE